ncbi:MAG: hypothetical protein ACO2OY_01405 [Thermodesulfobacteriaceae bacterium]|jgi:hypothetical protein
MKIVNVLLKASLRGDTSSFQNLLIIEENNRELKEVASSLPQIKLMLHRDEPCGARLKA